MHGCTHIQGDDAWIRLSDVIWQWFKPLNPWQVNAVKSLVSPDALADERHPLRSGEERGLELFVGIFPSGKARLLMSLRQLEYIQYYIKAMKLIQPTDEAVERYRVAVAELRAATEAERREGLGSQDGSDGEDEAGRADKQETEGREIAVSKLADLPLPSSKFFLLRKDLTDIVPVQLTLDDDLKRAMQNPRPWYARAKGQATEQDAGSGTGTAASTRPVISAVARDDVKDRVEDSVARLAEIELGQEAGEEEAGKDDRAWTPIEESTEGSKAADVDADATSGPGLLFRQAEQIYVAASHGPEVTSAAFPEPAAKPIPLGPASFLTIDFQVWEEEYGVVLDVGWSACWFEKEEVGKDAGIGSWQEQRTGGHWIVQENEHRLNSNMKCSIDGSIARIPYVGTGESEVLPMDQVLSRVKKLVPMMHEKAQGGSVFVIIHSNDTDLSSLRHLGLSIEDWKLDLASDDSASGNKVYVIDTSEMTACISNSINKQNDSGVPPIARSGCSLERLAKFLLKGHPALSIVAGNSGNMADAKLECFLVMVIKGVAKCCLAVNGESLEIAEDPAVAEGWAQDANLLEALAQQDDADRTILMHEAARRRRQMLARTGQAEDDDATDSQESYDSELEDERLLIEYDLEYEIGGGGPEDGIEDD